MPNFDLTKSDFDVSGDLNNCNFSLLINFIGIFNSFESFNKLFSSFLIHADESKLILDIGIFNSSHDFFNA